MVQQLLSTDTRQRSYPVSTPNGTTLKQVFTIDKARCQPALLLLVIGQILVTTERMAKVVTHIIGGSREGPGDTCPPLDHWTEQSGP